MRGNQRAKWRSGRSDGWTVYTAGWLQRAVWTMAIQLTRRRKRTLQPTCQVHGYSGENHDWVIVVVALNPQVTHAFAKQTRPQTPVQLQTRAWLGNSVFRRWFLLRTLIMLVPCSNTVCYIFVRLSSVCLRTFWYLEYCRCPSFGLGLEPSVPKDNGISSSLKFPAHTPLTQERPDTTFTAQQMKSGGVALYLSIDPSHRCVLDCIWVVDLKRILGQGLFWENCFLPSSHDYFAKEHAWTVL